MKRQSGFTLIEVLLAIAIGGILMTMMFTGLDTAVRTRQKVADYSTPYAIGPAILDRLEADLQNAYCYDIKDNDYFWGADAEVSGKEADGISFISATPAQVGEESLKSSVHTGREGVEADDRFNQWRRGSMSEVQYVCRPSRRFQDTLELWRREDFYVDDSVHEGGLYRMVYDRVFSLRFEYVRRNTTGGGGIAGATERTADQMRQDGWACMEEDGLPRAVIVTLAIYAREPEDRIDAEPEVFTFRRWIPLPQAQVSTDSEKQVMDWPGTLTMPSDGGGGGARNRGGRNGPGGGPDQPGQQVPGGGRRGGGRGGRPGTPSAGGAAGGNNPFLQALQNRGNRGGGGGGGNNPFANLFRPGGR